MKNDLNDKQIQILEVAETLFAEKGFDGTSIRDISKVAKINVAMVSYYFGSKEKLLESLVLFKTSGLKERLVNLIEENLEPFEKVNKLIELYINRLNCNRGIYRILHFELSSKKKVLELESFLEIKKSNLKSLELIIKEGQAKGVFRKDVIIELLTPTILGTYFHFQMNKPFFEDILNLKTEEAYNNYVKTDLTKHIQQTIKALLIYEN
ncbi:TetR/AcrR family transcriptional regulator [Flavobacterium franklandianum]|uniref:TetR/AcrR family transcriptional regulator n=1 Tax=Flavobacterium franklandianum TaxID=2594430 RepID=A0A553CNK1_9FLAO|nr:TetR family transcriptional regulator [Flavobacterium franklandianum]TRX22102.1 TetR/AcrR family transcriptional regulator [Flavobacterium franklandianum]TRX28676.1 TetR/AcrR family transcriptional regulator [Flavobacterium franklandianum]